MTKIKLHFSQKTMTKTKSYFAVKMNTAAWAYCTGDDRLQDVERPAGTQPPTPALATSQGAHHLSSTNPSMVNLPTTPPPTVGGKMVQFSSPFPSAIFQKKLRKEEDGDPARDGSECRTQQDAAKQSNKSTNKS